MSENTSKHSGRRRFIANAGAGLAGAGLLTAKSYARVVGANERIQLGVIGAGGRGRSVMGSFNGFPQVCEFIHVCDVYEPNINAALKLAREGAKSTMDYKELLANKDVVAVLNATPIIGTPTSCSTRSRRERTFTPKSLFVFDRTGREDGQRSARDKTDRPGRHAAPQLRGRARREESP